MKAAIEVKDRNEAGLVKTAMENPEVKALVLVIGSLLSLPTDRARRRVLQLVQDRLEEEKETADKPDLNDPRR